MRRRWPQCTRTAHRRPVARGSALSQKEGRGVQGLRTGEPGAASRPFNSSKAKDVFQAVAPLRRPTGHCCDPSRALKVVPFAERWLRCTRTAHRRPARLPALALALLSRRRRKQDALIQQIQPTHSRSELPSRRAEAERRSSCFASEPTVCIADGRGVHGLHTGGRSLCSALPCRPCGFWMVRRLLDALSTWGWSVNFWTIRQPLDGPSTWRWSVNFWTIRQPLDDLLTSG